MFSDEKETMIELYITDISNCKSFLRSRFCEWLSQSWHYREEEVKDADGKTWCIKKEITIKDVEDNLPFMIYSAPESHAEIVYRSIVELARFRVKAEVKTSEHLKYADGRYPCVVNVPTCPTCGHELDAEG